MYNELKVFELNKYKDNRGFFRETFNSEISDFINCGFVQDNESYSKKNVIRGMHYQWDKPMGKLVRCSFGSVIDVVVDIRKSSKTFGEVSYFELTSENNKVLWIPPGFAHGFEVLSDFAYLSYKCSEYYNKNGEGVINPFDNSFNIKWSTKTPIISDKDKNGISFFEYNKDIKFWSK